MDKAMQATYGFPITRNYTLQIDRSSLFIWTDNAAQAEVSP